jgi:hypothetical protein
VIDAFPYLQDTDARLSGLFARTTARLRWKELVA